MESEPTYDIHEKIYQLETELLQHELLIRRQKHVINSLKTMINAQSPPRGVSSGSAAANHNATSSTSAVAMVPAPRNTSSVNMSRTANATPATQKKTGPATAIVVRPINKQKKKTAMAKVSQFCKTIPKFGTEVAPKRKRTTATTTEGAQSNKRQASDVLETRNPSIHPPTHPAAAVAINTSNSRRASSRERMRGSDGEEEENDQADEEAFLASASAKLTYLNAIRNNNNSNTSNTNTSNTNTYNSNTSNSTTSSNGMIQQRAPRAAMIPILMPTTSSANKVVSSSSDRSDNSSGNSGSKITSVRPITNTSSNTNNTIKPTQTLLTTNTTNANTNTSNTTNDITHTTSNITIRPSTTTTTTTTPTSTPTTTSTRHIPPILTTPKQNTTRIITLSSPITSPRNLLTGSTYKNLAIFDYCKQVHSLDDKLEVAKDMHSNIINNPRRLQQFLDSTGGRDLFLSWLMECMERMQAGDLREEEELARTKLMEYTVLLINQAFWNAKSVSELKFDKTLKNLYRLFEERREPHHVTVSNIVKAIWPSYRIMRKQHESHKNKTIFVVD